MTSNVRFYHKITTKFQQVPERPQPDADELTRRLSEAASIAEKVLNTPKGEKCVLSRGEIVKLFTTLQEAAFAPLLGGQWISLYENSQVSFAEPIVLTKNIVERVHLDDSVVKNVLLTCGYIVPKYGSTQVDERMVDVLSTVFATKTGGTMEDILNFYVNVVPEHVYRAYVGTVKENLSRDFFQQVSMLRRYKSLHSGNSELTIKQFCEQLQILSLTRRALYTQLLDDNIENYRQETLKALNATNSTYPFFPGSADFTQEFFTKLLVLTTITI